MEKMTGDRGGWLALGSGQPRYAAMHSTPVLSDKGDITRPGMED